MFIGLKPPSLPFKYTVKSWPIDEMVRGLNAEFGSLTSTTFLPASRPRSFTRTARLITWEISMIVLLSNPRFPRELLGILSWLAISIRRRSRASLLLVRHLSDIISLRKVVFSSVMRSRWSLTCLVASIFDTEASGSREELS